VQTVHIRAFCASAIVGPPVLGTAPQDADGSQPQLEIRLAGVRTAVTDGPATVELGDDELIEAVMGRLDETSGFSATVRVLLSMMP
jgi:hypothetical protein